MTDFISSTCRAPFLTIIVRFSVVHFVFSVSCPVSLIMWNAAVNSYQADIYKKRQLCFKSYHLHGKKIAGFRVVRVFLLQFFMFLGNLRTTATTRSELQSTAQARPVNFVVVVSSTTPNKVESRRPAIHNLRQV